MRLRRWRPPPRKGFTAFCKIEYWLAPFKLEESGNEPESRPHLQSEVVWLTIRGRDFDEGVHLAHRRDEIRYKTSQCRLQFHLLGLVSPDVLVEILDLW